MTNSTYVLTTLGSISLTRVGHPSADLVGQTRPLLLLALLAQSPRLSGRRDHLSQLLWPDSDSTRARRSLRQTLFRLTKHAPDLVIRDGERLTLNRDVIRVDCWDLEGAVKGHDYAKVIELYKGPFLQGQESKVSPELEHWIESQNSHIRGGVELAYAKFVDEAIREHATETAVRHAREFAKVNPLDEAAQIMLVRALRADGDEVAALGAYQAYRTLLEKEVGDTPPSEWEDRMERVRTELFAPVVQFVAPEVDRRAIPPADMRDVALPRRFAAVPIAALVVAIVGITASVSLRPRPTGPLSDLSGYALVSVVQGTDTTLTTINIDGSGTDAKRVPEIKSTAVRSPNARWYAFAQAASDGWNLAVRDMKADSILRLTSAPEDEFPLAWSPDSRFVVYARRRVQADGRNYVHDVRIVDVVTGRTRRVAPPLTSAKRPSVSWSPDGTSLVLTAENRGESDIFVVDFDGRRLRNITRNVAEDLDPVWSPDRERIAFISRRADGVDLMTMRPDGTDLQQVVRVDPSARTPRWLSTNVILYLVDTEEGGDLWAVDVFGGQTKRLTFRGDVVDLSAILEDDGDLPWIETISIGPRHTTVSPGQYVSLGVHALDAVGDTVQVGSLPVTWATDARSLSNVFEPGKLRVTGVGNFLVTASLAGWRIDTLHLSSRPVIEQAILPAVYEDWTSERHDQTWQSFGEPVPTTFRGGSPAGGRFVNNGDAFFESGVVLRQPVLLDSGVTVEAYGRMPFTGQLHQTYGISIRRDLPNDSLELESNGFIVDFRVQGPSADEPARAWIATTEQREFVPVPERADRWHRYALQLHSDGRIDVLVDGAMHWRSSLVAFPPRRVRGPGYVTLGYRSFQTEITHGPIFIYEGIRYQVDSLAADNPSVGGSAFEPR